MGPVGRRKKQPKAVAEMAVAAEMQPAMITTPAEFNTRLALLVVAVLVGIWAYWPTLLKLVRGWESNPDYSHGYLVAPLTIYFLYASRKSFPGCTSPAWGIGLGLLLLNVALRMFAAFYYFDAVDGWSIVLWIAAAVALIMGAPALKWSFPAIFFLAFMVPLPYQVEGLLSLPLQRIATILSCWQLQLLGQPAIAEGNTILLGEHVLEVEQACSGLRLFMSILALAYAYLLLVKRAWWEKLLLIGSIVPVAIFANSVRIVATGLLFEFASTDAARKFSHDFAGWAMIPLAAVLFWFVLWFLEKLVPEQEQLDLGSLVRRVEI